MLFDLNNIKQNDSLVPAKVIVSRTAASVFKGKSNEILSKHLGVIEQGKFYQFYSFGRFSMHDIIVYLIKQIGPAHILCGTWSISQNSIEQLVRLKNRGNILSMQFVLDPRVKVTKAKPLQMLIANFPFVLTAWHAKVTTLENDKWNISVVSSQNMTQNPKIERGCIFTDKDTFEFDKQVLLNELHRRRISID